MKISFDKLPKALSWLNQPRSHQKSRVHPQDISLCRAFLPSQGVPLEDRRPAIEPIQKAKIIEISHTGIGCGARNDRFQLFGKNCFQIVCPNFDETILQHQVIIKAPLNTAEAVFLHETSSHSAAASVSLFPCVSRTA